MNNLKKLAPCLWFDDQAEEAMRYYVSIFRNSRVLSVTPGPNGKAAGVEFEIDGQRVMGMNAGPEFKFNEAVSMFVSCTDQAEVDELWGKLAQGGEESRCGWVKDKFGLWWQIIPTALSEGLADKDPQKAKAVLDAMLTMGKIDIRALEQARGR